MPRYTIDLNHPTRAAAKYVCLEMDFGRDGAKTFHAQDAVIDWGAVKAQMLYVHGCVKITRDARPA